MRVRSQKSKGMNRVLTYFHPADLIVFNLLCQHVHLVSKNRYLKNTYFSRSLHSKPKDDLIKAEGSFFYDIYGGTFKQWKNFSDHRAKLGKKKHLKRVVFTDIANFFDTVQHQSVRVSVLPNVRNSEIIDLLISFLEDHCFRPRYSSHLRFGLPQDSFDCSRVLANLILIKIDRLLEKAKIGIF